LALFTATEQSLGLLPGFFSGEAIQKNTVVHTKDMLVFCEPITDHRGWLVERIVYLHPARWCITPSPLSCQRR
jgi:hypothetical protein